MMKKNYTRNPQKFQKRSSPYRRKGGQPIHYKIDKQKLKNTPYFKPKHSYKPRRKNRKIETIQQQQQANWSMMIGKIFKEYGQLILVVLFLLLLGFWLLFRI